MLSQIYEFEGFRLDVKNRQLFKLNNERIDIRAKLFELLVFLIENKDNECTLECKC
jgi:DNA-binding winged helix-turn-helix (wHTH) protein